MICLAVVLEQIILWETIMKIRVINGPNLNMLGIREPDIYGKTDYKALCTMIEEYASEKNVTVDIVQSNHEGDLVDMIQESLGVFDGIVINPGAYTHYSYAIHDALASVTTMKKVEIHISDITKRDRQYRCPCFRYCRERGKGDRGRF